MCLLVGIRVRSFHGTIPLWGMLERLEASLPVHGTSRAPLRAGVLAASACHSLRTPLAKARYPIINMHTIAITDSFMQCIILAPCHGHTTIPTVSQCVVTTTMWTVLYLL